DIIAKAYGQYALHHNKVSGDIPGQEAIGQTLPEFVQQDTLHLLTGDRVQRNGMFDNLRDNLTSAFNEHRTVVARASAGLLDDFVQHTQDGMRNNHTYAVVGWDPRGANGGTVTLSDPSTRD